MSIPITLNGLAFDEAEDADGIVWCWDALEGWWGSADTRIASSPRTPHGDTVTSARHTGRALVLRGIAKGPDASVPLGETTWTLAARKLAGAANIVESTGLLEVDEPVATQAYVRRVGRIREARVGRLQWYRFEIPLLAEDPRRYSQTLTTDTGLSISGAGTSDTNTITLPTAANGGVDTGATITIDGPAVNPKIVNAGDSSKFVQWTGTLGAAETLVFDLDLQTVTLDGVNDIENLTAGSEFFRLRPGANLLTYTRSSGASASTAQFDYRVAYA